MSSLPVCWKLSDVPGFVGSARDMLSIWNFCSSHSSVQQQPNGDGGREDELPEMLMKRVGGRQCYLCPACGIDQILRLPFASQGPD